MGLTYHDFGNIPPFMNAIPAFASPHDAFAEAARRIGQVRLGELCGRTQGAVSKRLKSGKAIWDSGILDVEAEAAVSRHDLRPDLYPREDSPAQPPAGSPLPPAGGSRGRDGLEGLRA